MITKDDNDHLFAHLALNQRRVDEHTATATHQQLGSLQVALGVSMTSAACVTVQGRSGRTALTHRQPPAANGL
ncbi:hypothetical protein [Streptomyces wuyuanensis]|uniref:hypothetical protein n=1 Tax=Streptomyces wuyuanensis TaxID=1196353 RepID=UPI00378E0E98